MKITKKELNEMIREAIKTRMKKRINESLDDPYDKNVANEVGEILSNINPKTFLGECKGKTNEQTAEYLYKQYLNKYKCSDLNKFLNRDKKCVQAIRNLGGFPLMYCISMYCQRNSK